MASGIRGFFGRTAVRWTLGTLATLIVAIQFVPYGRAHDNPPVTGTPDWDSPRTEELVRRACFDCHSNETKWPWYASVAPLSWRIQGHVDEGREHLNFSEFDRPQDDTDEAAEMVRSGEMPLWDYAMMHPGARLSDAETRELIAGLTATFGGREGSFEPDEEREHDH